MALLLMKCMPCARVYVLQGILIVSAEGSSGHSNRTKYLPCKSSAYFIELLAGKRAIYNDRAVHGHLGLCIAPHDSI